MENLVDVKNISMTYHAKSGETQAIHDVSFAVREGEFISVVGPSGCGKSTLLSIISGLVKASSGEVFFGGEKVVSPSGKIGYMLQKDHLFEWRNIWDNVNLGLEIQGKKDPDYAMSLVKKYGLYDFRKSAPSQLSGGMRQRAALIRTLAVRPALLLLDEPFSALDYQTRLAVSDEVGEIIKRENKTAILVTHDISEAISLSDRVIVLSKRPSEVKTVHDIILSVSERSAVKSREAPEFREYFNMIWKELDVHA
ncbi:spermidine/putrescine ABC transporter ATP-binding protein [Clostridia bacterium]|nr:spermidine/putrescine ABC transporter ATP-binding protein [Clostridia bacterium]